MSHDPNRQNRCELFEVCHLPATLPTPFENAEPEWNSEQNCFVPEPNTKPTKTDGTCTHKPEYNSIKHGSVQSGCSSKANEATCIADTKCEYNLGHDLEFHGALWKMYKKHRVDRLWHRNPLQSYSHSTAWTNKSFEACRSEINSLNS